MSWGKMKDEVEMLRDEVLGSRFFFWGITLGELYLAFLPPPQTWVIRIDAKWSHRAGPKIAPERPLPMVMLRHSLRCDECGVLLGGGDMMMWWCDDADAVNVGHWSLRRCFPFEIQCRSQEEIFFFSLSLSLSDALLGINETTHIYVCIHFMYTYFIHTDADKPSKDRWFVTDEWHPIAKPWVSCCSQEWTAPSCQPLEMEAREQMKKLRGELLALKEKDEEFVATCHGKQWEPGCQKKTRKMRGTD